MPRRPDPRKLTLWRERLQRFSSSGLPVAGFCAQEGVSASSFYNWRNKLQREAQQVGEVSPRRDAFRQVEVLRSAPGVSIHLSCGTRIEVGADQLDVVRAVIGEVARATVHPGDVAAC